MYHSGGLFVDVRDNYVLTNESRFLVKILQKALKYIYWTNIYTRLLAFY